MNDQESGKGLSVGRQPNFTAPVTALKKEEQASPSATKEGTTYLCVQCVEARNNCILVIFKEPADYNND